MTHYLSDSAWEWYKEKVGTSDNNSFTRQGLLEQINTTRDKSDYLWYTISINVSEELSPSNETDVFINIESLGHAALLFVNKKVAAFGYGNHDIASFSINEKVTLHSGENILEVLSMMVGLQNYGPWFDVAPAGLFLVAIAGFASGLQELSTREWTYQVGTEGEYLGLENMNNSHSSLWTSGNLLPTNQSLIWYKTPFIAPEGNGPLTLNLSSMGKGQAWINGQSIGRYWPAYLSPSTGCSEICDYRGPYNSNKCLKNCGEPSQILYHIPRSWVYPGKNLLILHEELGGDPSKITVSTKTGQEVCAHVSESDPPPVDSWKPSSMLESSSPEVHLSCGEGWRIVSVSFASFGTPQGQCGKFSHGGCSADVLIVVQEACLGRESCSVVVSTDKFGDPCPGILKSLAVEALCS